MKKTAIAVLFMAATAAPVVAQQAKPEDQIKYRRAAYTLMGLNMGNLAAMAQEKKPFVKEEADKSAALIAILATVPKGHFGAGTDKDTKARPEIWTKRADFDSKMDRMIAEAGKLPAAVQGGATPAFKKQVADTGAACKACHDDYRAK